MGTAAGGGSSQKQGGGELLFIPRTRRSEHKGVCNFTKGINVADVPLGREFSNSLVPEDCLHKQHWDIFHGAA